MDTKKLFTAAMLAMTFSLGLAACEDRKGPAERVGEEIDEAADEIEDAAD
jgi:predicted small lipoprotein YifL